ncbi:sigma-70 family RNA polymerase sigma factor [Acutalibacter muris]|uniref:Sigma-70 family RNA polymerase sigma factor n=1 Tax=Acutalibacter muris TaxID=1796620 RepID=A0A1Z2XU72_9FIRM|nr:sigma-70 family RNA polymerase sigma factor [Acutalibacter muris]ASB41939.1 sigma-70 family RNA polymerase sigma factor [Acutalibacter muris]QQR31204.1 sigma-70 family RNA polymerase sigma factor [Acutalibacter muris]
MVKYAPKKVFVLENGTYLELSYAQFHQQKDTYQGRRFLFLHGMLMEVSEDAYKAFYKDKRRQKYLNERSDDNGDFSYDMLTTDEFNGEDILVDEVADTAGEAERNLLLDKLCTALVELTEEERTLLVQYYSERMSECELSDIYEISQQAVSKRVRKILAKLKNLMRI